MIVVNNRAFRQALGIVGQCVERRNTIPILDSVKVSVNGKMELTGTDLDMSMHVGLPVGGADGGKAPEGQFLLENFRLAAKAVAAAGGDTVTLERVENGVSIRAGELALRSGNGISVEDWPTDQTRVAAPALEATLSPDHLAQIARITAAISTEETRYYLNGVYIHRVAEWTWRAAATDGHRLMFTDLHIPDAKGDADGIIIPRKALRIALDVMKKGKDGVALTIGGGIVPNQDDSTAPARPSLSRLSLAGRLGNLSVRLSTKTIDGTYPDYSRVIPQTHDWRVLVPVARLRQAINAAGAVFSRRPVMKLTFSEGLIEVSASSVPVAGLEASFRCEAQHNAPKGFVIGFNGDYLLDCINALHGPDLMIEGADSASPAMFRDPADGHFGAVLMPMRV